MNDKGHPAWLYRISVATPAAAEEAVSEWLGLAFGQPPSSYTNAETRQTIVSVYLRRKPDWSAARRKELAAALRRLDQSLCEPGRRRRSMNLDSTDGPLTSYLSPPEGERVPFRADEGFRGTKREPPVREVLSLTRIRQRDWAEAWKHHFRPLAIGSRLLLKPSWSRHRRRKGQTVVVLDPGLSFGTGHHPTTAFCLRQLVVRRRAGQPQSCLDVGTGSGILAIAAAKLGYQPVDALDFEPESIRVARANARRNSVSGKIVFRQQDFTTLPLHSRRKYSLICANLLAHLLSAERHRLLARLRTDGVLVAAGILKSEFARVQNAFAGAGLRLVASRAHHEWRSGAFSWR